MSGQGDQIKGRMKQAAGDITDDDEMRDEGERDEAAGKMKEKVGDFKEKVEGAIDRAKDEVNERT